jgi:hypothetical protein
MRLSLRTRRNPPLSCKEQVIGTKKRSIRLTIPFIASTHNCTRVTRGYMRASSTLSGVKIMGTILLVILILVLIGAFPSWPHSRNWGYGPSGVTGLIVVILIIMLVTGQL